MNTVNVDCKCGRCKQWFNTDDYKSLKETMTKILEDVSDDCYRLDVLCPSCSEE